MRADFRWRNWTRKEGEKMFKLDRISASTRFISTRRVMIIFSLMPITAHPGFNKACAYFKIKLVRIPLDPSTCEVDLRKMRRAINGNTCMVKRFSSVLLRPDGICLVDRRVSAELSSWSDRSGRRIGQSKGDRDEKRRLTTHVRLDRNGIRHSAACRRLSRRFSHCFHGSSWISVETIRFSSSGRDEHQLRYAQSKSNLAERGRERKNHQRIFQYGFAPKGTSVILYRNAELRSYQFFAVADWPGGIYGSPTVAGSRSGYLIACCWATMMYYGLDGYIRETRKIIEVARAIAKG